jgi:NAD(P)-dependent dehydrogenase (short-subunit alcohol dehydrogenase family)
MSTLSSERGAGRPAEHYAANVPSGTVLVTGASSGIGEATALHLTELGFDAVAAVRKDEDAERLAVSGLRTVKLDVADSESIAAARAELGDGPLVGLVNNAGIAVAAPLEFLPLDQFRHQLEINLVGQLAVTQQFLPALRAGRGRIVNVSSIGGRVALPLVGAYNASKFALEAMSDSLRRELLSLGVDVIVIEPGGVKTPIWRKGNELAAEISADMPPEAEGLYGRLMAALRTQTVKIATETGIEPREVAEAIGHALTAGRPRARYLVGRDAKMRGTAVKVLPARVMDRLVARAMGQG